MPRAKLLELIASLPPCLIGVEACSGAHYWAREFQKFGHTVRLMAPKFVIPYRLSGRRGKNDAADAAAICEAVARPTMRFVPIKSIEQQGQLMVHRARQGFVEQRTATFNRIRGLLTELGIVLALKAAVVRRDAMARLEDLPGWANTVIGDLFSEVTHLDERIAQYDRHIALMARQSIEAQRLMQLCGVGETTATALLSTIGNGRDFMCGWQLCAWLGLCPRTKITGGKVMSGKTKRCANCAAQAPCLAAAALRSSQSALGTYYRRMCARMDKPKAITAAAHKLTRLIYAMLTQGQEYTDRGQDYLEDRYRERVLRQKAKAMGMQLVPSNNPA